MVRPIPWSAPTLDPCAPHSVARGASSREQNMVVRQLHGVTVHRLTKPRKENPMKTASQTRRDVGTTFAVAAPQATEVFLAGEFNQWSPTQTAMERGKDGSWAVSLELPPGRYEYKFVADGQWLCEPGCESGAEGSRCIPNSFGTMNSVVDVT